MDQKSTRVLRESISHLAFSATPPSTPLRRSSRILRPPSTVKTEEHSSPLQHSPLQKKRKISQPGSDDGSPKKKKRPTKRGYADPATYAHLNALNDHLAPNLDIIFCGINPGQMSATKGHHFANPTNHFWKGLHLSGLTSRLLSPSEDSTLPALYNLGLTNLVERPSAEAAELSRDEMKSSVPSLKAKIIRYQPHIVCFVGKGIWLTVEAAFKNQVRQLEETLPSVRPRNGTNGPSPSTPQKCARKGKAKASSFNWGLQPYKLVYPSFDNVTIKHEQDILNGNVTAPAQKGATASAVCETLFFVMPSTSGRVVSHQLADKVKLFVNLRECLEKVKLGSFDTSAMVMLPPT